MCRVAFVPVAVHSHADRAARAGLDRLWEPPAWSIPATAASVWDSVARKDSGIRVVGEHMGRVQQEKEIRIMLVSIIAVFSS